MRDKIGKDLTIAEIIQKSNRRLQSICLEFIVYFLHCAGYIPIHPIRHLLYRIVGIEIGRGSTIHMGARFYDPRNILIGEDSVVGEGVVLDGRAKLVIGDHVDIASDVMIYNSEHNVNDENFQAVSQPVIIEDYVFIGPRAIVLPGVHIRKGAVVGAGAVVTKNVNSMEIVGGVPAKTIGERIVKDLHYRLGRSAWFR